MFFVKVLAKNEKMCYTYDKEFNRAHTPAGGSSGSSLNIWGALPQMSAQTALAWAAAASLGAVGSALTSQKEMIH